MATFGVIARVRDEMIAHSLDEYPLEACGLLAGEPNSGVASRLFPVFNAAKSARVYTLDPKGYLQAERESDALGLEIMGVFHSHTHTHAFPSPTDIAQAPTPLWRYLLVSLAQPEPVVRAFLIDDGKAQEVSLVVSSEEPPS